MIQHGMAKQDLLKEATGTFGVSHTGRGSVNNDQINIYNTEGRDNDDLLGATNTIQDKTFDATGRITAKIEDTKLVGTETLGTLTTQREQLQGINDEVDALETRVERAKRLVLGFTKKIANDRFIQFFAFVNCTLIITIILYVILEKKGLGDVDNDSGFPASSNSSSVASLPIQRDRHDENHQDLCSSIRILVGNILITLLMH